MLTRKDFKELAELVESVPHQYAQTYVARELAYFCMKHNKHFDEHIFWQECGLTGTQIQELENSVSK